MCAARSQLTSRGRRSGGSCSATADEQMKGPSRRSSLPTSPGLLSAGDAVPSVHVGS